MFALPSMQCLHVADRYRMQIVPQSGEVAALQRQALRRAKDVESIAVQTSSNYSRGAADEDSDAHSTRMQRTGKHEAIVLLLAHSELYLHHSCANTANMEDGKVLTSVVGVHSRPDFGADLCKLRAIDNLATSARQWHRSGDDAFAMYTWWMMVLLAQTMPVPHVDGQPTVAIAPGDKFLYDVRLHGVMARDLLLTLTQQRNCDAWVRLLPLVDMTAQRCAAVVM